jgi:branched-chain amino acid aminotransferase
MLQKYDPRNANIKVHVGGWEGLRVYEHGIFCLSRHLQRLEASAHALAFTHIPDETSIRKAIRETLDANGMKKDTHIRLTLTRGEKITSGMDPRLNTKGSCLIVLAEWKPLVFDNDAGIRVITSSQRRNNPQFLDSKIHHNNLLNNILAKIQANIAGVDGALMLDQHGFIAELNDTNLFIVKDGVVFTPFADACLHGITRGLVMELAGDNGIECHERNLSLTEAYNADEVFATGTMGELTPVVEIDGRKIVNRSGNKVLRKLQDAFQKVIPKLCERI